MKRHVAYVILLFVALSSCTDREIVVTPLNALQSYLNAKDKSFAWEIKEEFEEEGLKVAVLRLTSQTWRNIPWTHQLTVISPSENPSGAALLFITGGSNREGEPNWKGKDEEIFKMISMTALKNNATAAIISQVPNQPLYDDLTEDALISYTLHNFRNDRDFTWPLLFPMTKSAIKAMDAIQQYSERVLKQKIDRFVIAGASKRGWTTWLTGSQDKRVAAIAPMVIDVLNMPENITYQKEVWGDYSVEIGDYVRLGIAQDLETPAGRDLTTMIDPYSYRSSLTMPKLILIGTNDEYWPVDAVKNYLDDIPGDNYLHYEPNVGHSMGDGSGVMRALSAFSNMVIYNKKQNGCEWDVLHDSVKTELNIKASPDLKEAVLWICDSPDRDFRNDGFNPVKVEYNDFSNIKLQVDYPASGFRAFYVELVYPDPVDGTYSISTRMFVASDNVLFLD